LKTRSPAYWFAKTVQKGTKPGECKHWSGALNRDGKPIFRGTYAQRYAYWLHHHPEEPYALTRTVAIQNTCGCAICVNPAHLVAVPMSELPRSKRGPNTKYIAVTLVCKKGHDLSRRLKDKTLDRFIRDHGCPTCREQYQRAIRIGKRVQAIVAQKTTPESV
jgi:hypothetical protein